MPAPMSVARPKTHGRQPSPTNAASMILSLLQKPANGGTPRIASQPSPKVTQVIFMTPDRLPKPRMSTLSFMPCMTDPAPRNIPALKKPWVSRWKIAKA
jgi:hypothetical protein